MINVLIRQVDFTVTCLNTECWIEASAITLIKVSMVIEFFHHRVYAKGHGVAQADVVIDLSTDLPEAINAHLRLRKCIINNCFLGHPVQHTTCSASAKQERIRTAKNLYLLQVIERSIILDIVSHAIDVKIRRRSHTTENNRVPVTFTLRRCNTGHVGNHLTDTVETALSNISSRHETQALWNIQYWCGRL